MIWIFLVPIFIFAAWPAFKWMQKANSGDIDLSKDDYSVFNSQEGEIHKAAPAAEGTPELDNGIMGVLYKPKTAAEKTAAEARGQEKEAPGKRPAPVTAGDQGRGGRTTTGQDGADSIRARELQTIGYAKGYLTTLLSKVMNNPKAVGTLFDNKFVVTGFMARDTVKAATASPQGLANFLKSGEAADFINHPLVKAALNNPAMISAVATSGLVSALLDTPAAKALMNDPKALANLINSNPELVSMIMANPNAMKMLTNNPDVSGLMSKFDTSEIKKE